MTATAQPKFDTTSFNIGDRVQYYQHRDGTTRTVHGTIVDIDRSATITKCRVQLDSGAVELVGRFLLSPSSVPKPDNENKPENDNQPTPEPTELPFLNPADWQGKPVPEREWFLEGLIPNRQVTLLSGDGGVGKSLLALQIAAASAMGCETLGMHPKTGRVMYLGAEDDEDEFHRRLADITYQHQRQLSDLQDFRLIPMADRDALLANPDRAGVMHPTATMVALIDKLTAFRPGFLVLDTSADLFGGDEIKRAQVRQFVSMLRKQAIGLDMAVMLLSHPSVAGMQSGSGSSGSTGWNNSVRSRLYLTANAEDSDLRVLTTKKSNYGKLGGDLKLQWQEGCFIIDDGKPSPAAGLLNKHHDELFRSLLSAINRTGQRVAPTKGANYAPAVMEVHPDSQKTSRHQFAAAMQRLLAAGIIKVIMDGPPSRQRQRLIVSAEDFGPQEEVE